MHTKYSTLLIRTPKNTVEKEINSHCFDVLLTHTRTDRIIIDARRKLTPDNPRDFIVFVSKDGKHPDNWVKHRIATDRDTILKSKILNPSTLQVCHFLYGKLSFSRNGKKITAYAPVRDGGGRFIRISTDIGVLEHVATPPSLGYYTVHWYYDP